MKTKLTIGAVLFTALLTCAGNSFAQVDLVPGINYSYNPPGANGIITGITVDACNNGGSAASAFDVSIYLYETNSGNYWIIGSTRLNNGLSGNACLTISNWDIDINNTANIPAGTYRIGTWVDSGTEVSESDENNNAGLMSGNINYSPSPNAMAEKTAAGEFIRVLPNPSSGLTNFRISLAQQGPVSLKIYDIAGKELHTLVQESLGAGTHDYFFDVKELDAGIYFLSLNGPGTSKTERFIVTK